MYRMMYVYIYIIQIHIKTIDECLPEHLALRWNPFGWPRWVELKAVASWGGWLPLRWPLGCTSDAPMQVKDGRGLQLVVVGHFWCCHNLLTSSSSWLFSHFCLESKTFQPGAASFEIRLESFMHNCPLAQTLENHMCWLDQKVTQHPMVYHYFPMKGRGYTMVYHIFRQPYG